MFIQVIEIQSDISIFYGDGHYLSTFMHHNHLKLT